MHRFGAFARYGGEEQEMTHDVTPEIQKTEQEWKAQLGPERYRILREAGTEAPFSGSLLQVNDDGTYVCGACGQPLFTSVAKFESHCGWPSFTHPEEQKNVRLLDDHSHGMQRIEVRCKGCDSHLGHVFDDGPGPRGTRYCINSRSLDFTPSQRP
jgi:peptide-methionine (R)-S-oxide reductase